MKDNENINEKAIENEEVATIDEMAEETIESKPKKKMSKGAKAALIIGITLASLAIMAGLAVGGWHIYNHYMPSFITTDKSEDVAHSENNSSEDQTNTINNDKNNTKNQQSNKNSTTNPIGNGTNKNVNNNSSKTTTTNSSNKSSQTQTSSNRSPVPSVTIYAQVANGVCIVGGSCSKDTEYITISGDKVQQTTVIPFDGESLNYFITQVKYSGATTLQITAKETGKEVSNIVKRNIGYSNLGTNYMTEGEYRAVIGKDSRIHFYSALLSYSLSTNKLTSDMRALAHENISQIVTAANNVGAETIFYVIPSSAEIYPETVPDGYNKTTGESLYKAFKGIAESCGAKVIYPLDTMKSHKNDGVGYQIYQHTDSHWSTYGAYWGTYDLFQYISKDFPAAKPRAASEMGFYTAELYGGDALFNFPENTGFENYVGDGRTRATGIKELTTLYSLNMHTSTLGRVYNGNSALYLTMDNEDPEVIINPYGSGLPKAVIMRDSFSKIAYDIINDRFSEVRWGNFNNYDIPYEDIYMGASGNPDYVIYMYSERNLLKVMLGDKYANILMIR